MSGARIDSITSFVDDLVEKVAAECSEAEIQEKLASNQGQTSAGKGLRELALRCRALQEAGIDLEKTAAERQEKEGMVKLSHVREIYEQLKARGRAAETRG